MSGYIKAKALANYLGISPDDIEESYENFFTVIDDGDEYLVLTEDESLDFVFTTIEQEIEDLGMDAFTKEFQEWIFKNAINGFALEDYYINDVQDLKAIVKSTRRIERILDLDKIVNKCIELDGIGHFLATYDGEEIDLGTYNGEELFAYQTN